MVPSTNLKASFPTSVPGLNEKGSSRKRILLAASKSQRERAGKGEETGLPKWYFAQRRKRNLFRPGRFGMRCSQHSNPSKVTSSYFWSGMAKAACTGHPHDTADLKVQVGRWHPNNAIKFQAVRVESRVVLASDSPGLTFAELLSRPRT